MDATAISNKMGMPELIALDESMELLYIQKIRDGIPIQVLDSFIETGILFKKDAERCIGSDRTLSRRRHEGTFSAEESDKFLRFIRTVIMAVDIFGSSEKAHQWFYEPNKTLSNKKPYELLDTDIGIRLVERTLDRIAYGVFS